MRPLRLATVFSGIGAIEWALRRLSIPYEVVFACDNGEREIEYDLDTAKKEIASLASFDDVADYQRALYSKHTRKKNYVEAIYLQNYGDRISANRFFPRYFAFEWRSF